MPMYDEGDLNFIEIERFPGYSINKTGDVFSQKSGYVLTPHIQRMRSGTYYTIGPWKDGKNHTVYIHHLVVEIFLPPKPFTGAVIRHLDGDSFNNYYKNLQWGSRQDDVNDKKKHGKPQQGLSRFSAEIIKEIRVSKESDIMLGYKYFVNRETIRKIKRGITYVSII